MRLVKARGIALVHVATGASGLVANGWVIIYVCADAIRGDYWGLALRADLSIS